MIIDGKAISDAVMKEVEEEISLLKRDGKRLPGLAVILLGGNPASNVYVRNKRSACDRVGIPSFKFDLPADTSQEGIIALLDELNAREDVDGILVQLPLPEGIDDQAVLERVNPAKDVDGFHPLNMGLLVENRPGLAPCTPLGIMELLNRTGVEIEGKSAVIVGRSNIVGKPVAMMLLHRHATVTICHSRTRNIKDVTAGADILVAAVGRPRFIKEEMVKEGAVVIDVGINRLDGKLVGDVDYHPVSKKASAITPVPGGVGPMTIAMLLKNTLAAYRLRTGEGALQTINRN